MKTISIKTLGLAVLLRVVLIYLDNYLGWELARRPEFNTSLTSVDKLNECLFLLRRGSNPYSSQLCHSNPLLMAIFMPVAPFGRLGIHSFLIVLDIVTALVLARFAQGLIALHPYDGKSEGRKTGFMFGTKNPQDTVPTLAATLYLFNPWTIASCAACNLTIFENLSVALALRYAVQGKFGPATLWIAMASFLGFYPITFIVAIANMIQLVNVKGTPRAPGTIISRMSLTSGESIRTLLATVLATGVWLAALTGLAYSMFMSWDYLRATLGFILEVKDLTPNIGLFWYLNTEMFDFFRPFFLFVFHYNVFIYAVPIRSRLPMLPHFNAFVTLIIISVFKAYPTLAETGFYVAFLPMLHRELAHLRFSYFVSNVFVYTTVLRPIFWHFWINTGTGNANFFWAVCMAFTLAQLWMMVDMIRSACIYERNLLPDDAVTGGEENKKQK